MEYLTEIATAIRNEESIDEIRALIETAITEDKLFVKKANSENHILFHLAIQSKIPRDLAITNLLLEFGFDPNHGYKDHLGTHYPLFEAISTFEYEVAMRLCQVTTPNLQADSGHTALFYLYSAVQHRTMFIDHKRPEQPRYPTTQDQDELRQLLFALLEHGHDINALSNDGYNVLFNPIDWKQPFLVRLLVDAGAKVNVIANDYPKIVAINGNVEIVELLLERGLDVNHNVKCTDWMRKMIGCESFNLLTIAILHDNYEAAQVLVAHGAGLDIEVKEDMTLWDVLLSPENPFHVIILRLMTRIQWHKNFTRRLELIELMEAEETRRKMKALGMSYLVKESELPTNIIRMIASPLWWSPKEWSSRKMLLKQENESVGRLLDDLVAESKK